MKRRALLRFDLTVCYNWHGSVRLILRATSVIYTEKMCAMASPRLTFLQIYVEIMEAMLRVSNGTYLEELLTVRNALSQILFDCATIKVLPLHLRHLKIRNYSLRTKTH